MTTARAYCDWNATAPISPDVAAAVAAALSLGNPSSIHHEGRAARAAVDAARAEVAMLAGVSASQIVFTSGGTEAASTALQPVHADAVLFAGAAEHACVRAGGGYAPARRQSVPVDSAGRVTPEALEAAVSASGIAVGLVHVAVQAANNETGALTPLDTFELCRARGWRLTIDAVQAAGRVDLAPYAALADELLISGHKIGAPKGVGALVLRADVCANPRPLIRGGGQERGHRAGTENVAGIVGFGMAARQALAGLAGYDSVTSLRDRFERRLQQIAPDVTIFAAEEARIGNTSLFAVEGLKAQTALIAFDLDQIAVSSGSACSSGKVASSHVLAAMGVRADRAVCAIRASFGPTSVDADVDRLLDSLERQLARLRTRRQSAA